MEKLNCSVHDVADSVEEMIKSGASVPVYISGNSMNPFLIDGRDIVYLKTFDDADMKKGKILLFRRSNGETVLHRLYRVCPDGKLQMNGDGQVWCEAIEKKQVIAAVGEIERKGKKSRADSLQWKTVNFCWRLLKPLRSFIMRVWRKCRRIKIKI